jgi:outer membrane protein assembly factor BamE (lipoprotein component of BamABCDE complex)
MKLSILAVPLLIGLLAGCAGIGSLVPGQATQADVRASLGTPTETRRDGNDELWEYAGGAEGHESHLVRLGPDGKVKEVTQLVTEERLLTVVPGRTTRQDVRTLLGRPAEHLMTGVGETWSWRYAVNGLRGHLVVSFNPDGTVRERGAVIDAIYYDSAN